MLLGAGFVTKPTVQILSEAGVSVTVACRTLANAKELAGGFAGATPISLDVNDATALDEAVAKVDLVISLIPYTFHATVIKSAIRQKKNVVTTSYVSDAMLALEQEAKDAGITVMNEIGLDPGIDHLYAVKMIDEVHKEGGKIINFLSYCGGLPAPEASKNPLGYKFSWSPRGVLLAARNTARYLKDGKATEIPGPQLMKSAERFDSGFIGYAFVGYPNRDSTPYRERYLIPEVQTCIRGTLRYDGGPEFMQVLVDLGFLKDDPTDYLAASSAPITWAEATQKLLAATSSQPADLEWAIASKTTFKDTKQKQRILAGLRWLGLFSDSPVTARGNPLDSLCATLEQKMQYAPGERDLVFLQHRFDIEWKDGRKETRTSTLVDYGEPTGPNSTSAMAKLVGVPCGVACLMVLDGRISEKVCLEPFALPRISEEWTD